jgi:hypothetical protein
MKTIDILDIGPDIANSELYYKTVYACNQLLYCLHPSPKILDLDGKY